MRNNHIALIGFMCAGKSTAGAVLAKRLGYPFYDSDSVVEQKIGMKIAEIFERQGENVFRRLEAEALVEICRLERLVLATGGGAVLTPENRALLEKTHCVYLRLTEAELAGRLMVSRFNRPLIGRNIEDDVSRLMLKRGEIYLSLASITIDADGKSPELIAEEIIERVSYEQKKHQSN